ncbi:hypothetical protein [Roseiterribacter gracilis]|uniref:Uncharacterized protein n=1 Tax=Roseiterribacter gracilis TaxID=2812848 RepID=A0A8S8XBU4_9PROT|nr:hypothetical protein TMPK1_24110 [Rhodospirillales bacterium TMPK1]
MSETPLRAALERLDEMIDRMEASLARREAQLPQTGPDGGAGEPRKADPRLALAADRLDRVIAKLEAASRG